MVPRSSVLSPDFGHATSSRMGNKIRRSVIGLDIGGTKTAVVEGSLDGQILQRVEMPTQAHEPCSRTFPKIAEQLRIVVQKADQAGRSIVALSVAVGGPLRIEEGLLLDPPHLPGWHQINLKELLASEFPILPVYVEHDGNAGALAEFYFGAGKNKANLQHLIFLTFGTGLGAGIIANGQILHGASGLAGEVGHWRLGEEGPFCYGKTGSWEAFSSGSGLVQLASIMYPFRWNQSTRIREVVDAMLQDDDEALAVASVAGTWMGRGLSLLIDALNPQVIVLGSLGVLLGERILAPARRVIAQEALPQARSVCEIMPAVLGTRIGDVAALMAALTEPAVQRLLEEDSE